MGRDQRDKHKHRLQEERGRERIERIDHAAILCLSIALVIAAFVVVNNDALHWIANKNLNLNLFFLGYSFPLSLLSMSVMFSFVEEVAAPFPRMLLNFFFWFI
jgi:hypothetical protein